MTMRGPEVIFGAYGDQSRTATSTSISTAPPRGSAATPIADRECRPAAPNTAASNSLAPSTTAGCCTKPGAQATNPSTVSTRSIRSRSPSSARRTESAFSAHHRAASAPCSTLRSAPSVPGWTSAPSWLRGSCPDVRIRPPCTTTASSGSCGGYGPGSVIPSSANRSSIVGRTERGVHPVQRRDGLARRVDREDDVVDAVLCEQGARSDQRGDVEVLERADLAGQNLRPAHVPGDRVGGAPRREVARHDRGAYALVDRGEEQRARGAVRQAAGTHTFGIDERVRGEHVERALQVPQVALVRDDTFHRGAHEIPVAVVLVVGHPVAALAEPAQ